MINLVFDRVFISENLKDEFRHLEEFVRKINGVYFDVQKTINFFEYVIHKRENEDNIILDFATGVLFDSLYIYFDIIFEILRYNFFELEKFKERFGVYNKSETRDANSMWFYVLKDNVSIIRNKIIIHQEDKNGGNKRDEFIEKMGSCFYLNEKGNPIRTLTTNVRVFELDPYSDYEKIKKFLFEIKELIEN